jgi:cysteine protease ATG4
MKVGDFILEDEDEPPFDGGDIEDDWVDPSISSPAAARSSSIPVHDLPTSLGALTNTSSPSTSTTHSTSSPTSSPPSSVSLPY